MKVGVSKCTQSVGQFGTRACVLQPKKPLEETKAEKRNASGRRGKTAKSGFLRARVPNERRINSDPAATGELKPIPALPELHLTSLSEERKQKRETKQEGEKNCKTFRASVPNASANYVKH